MKKFYALSNKFKLFYIILLLVFVLSISCKIVLSYYSSNHVYLYFNRIVNEEIQYKLWIFNALNFIKYDKWEFLSNDSLADAFNVYNKDIKIEVGQRGFGPGSKFGFSIGNKNYEFIKNGFTLGYKDSVLYGYKIIE